MADDMGFSDIGCYGSEIETPHLDALAASGIRFTQFYNAARCCPTRAALLTGLYPHQVGMGSMVTHSGSSREDGPYQGYLRTDSCVTIPEAIISAGYRSYMSGKWHVGEYPNSWPRQRGFDKYWGLISGASSYYEIIKDQPRERVMVLNDDRWEPTDTGFYMTDATTDYAIQWLREHQAETPDQPYLLYVAYTAPHWPLHALPEDIHKYEDRYHIGWDSLRQLRYQNQRELSLFAQQPELSARPESVPSWESSPDKQDWSLRMAVYAAMIDRMDQGVGRIIRQVESDGDRNNTCVIFLSDNGGCAEEITGRNLHDPQSAIGSRNSYVAYREPWANASNTPFRYYKQWTHQGGILTPFILSYPKAGLNKGSVIDAPAHVIDLMPTILSLANASYPKNHAIPMEGVNLFEVIAQSDLERTLYWEHIGNQAILKYPWKAVSSRGENWELYNLEDDPVEMHDQAAREPELLEEKIRLWQLWAAKVGVSRN